jgi:hypothetical protein
LLRHLAPLLGALACAAGMCLAALPAATPAAAGERDASRGAQSHIGEPPVFRDANGGAFRPRSIIVAGPRGAQAARVPDNARQGRGENRVDLSGAPLVGGLFRGTLDVASVRAEPMIGRVYRVGNALVVETVETPPNLAGRPVALATNVPRLGAVSFALGPLDWHAVPAPQVPRAAIGSAHLVGDELVLASQGGEPAFPSVGALFRSLF